MSKLRKDFKVIWIPFLNVRVLQCTENTKSLNCGIVCCLLMSYTPVLSSLIIGPSVTLDLPELPTVSVLVEFGIVPTRASSVECNSLAGTKKCDN